MKILINKIYKMKMMMQNIKDNPVKIVKYLFIYRFNVKQKKREKSRPEKNTRHKKIRQWSI